MLAPGAPKDNANPTIHAVEEDHPSKKQPPLGWSQLQSLNAFHDEETSDSLQFSQSPADRAVMNALLDTLEASQGDGVSLLRNAGVALPQYNMKEDNTVPYRQAIPRFIPSSFMEESKEEHAQELKDLKGKHDTITPDEIFTIIRSIQDPEHPGVTLASLRVVSRGQIEVEEGGMPPTDTGTTASENSSPKIPSVTVRFT